ncbi:EAL domain-containing protein [Pontibacterium granulatum]|uniref:EAL domain-containing protein n=1 Tax=Pontibacterium granulatum TaxID=2036029 RepID=UPI002499FAE0|nr:EAL domain-containing protein [Pontibacterium granulatum]MDI3323537.1 EAL domain-containing protein [Pontibacterium granulatum]
MSSIKSDGEVRLKESPVIDAVSEGESNPLPNDQVVMKELAFNRSLLEQYKHAVDISSIVSKTDPCGVITYVNDQFCRVSGHSREELVGATHRLIRHPDNDPLLFRDMWQTIRSRKTWQGIIKNRRKDGSAYYVDSLILPVLDPDGKIAEFMSIRTDVTDLIEQQSVIQRQFTDPLTGLPNRQKLISDHAEMDEVTCLLVDVCDFSEINEYHGYQVGDRLLKALALIMNRLIHSDSVLYHLGGDQFAILTRQSLNTEQLAHMCKDLARRIAQYPVGVEEFQFPVSVVIGAASGVNAFIEADIALHSAQEKERTYEIFSPDSRLTKRIEDNISWVGRIRDAIRHDRIEVYVQPIIDALTGHVAKYECLMRLRDDEGNLHSPYVFLEAAKRARLYDNLMQIVIYKAFRHFSDRDDNFSINLSARDIYNSETVAMLLDKALEYGVAERLIIEIVESEGIENYEKVLGFISWAKKIGCRIAVDDFGSGYSNFEYLLKLDIDYIKVDGSLIKHLDSDTNTQMLSDMIVSFGRKMGAETVAEFVHSEEVKQAAIVLGFDYLQGYHTGKPVSLDEI